MLDSLNSLNFSSTLLFRENSNDTDRIKIWKKLIALSRGKPLHWKFPNRASRRNFCEPHKKEIHGGHRCRWNLIEQITLSWLSYKVCFSMLIQVNNTGRVQSFRIIEYWMSSTSISPVKNLRKSWNYTDAKKATYKISPDHSCHFHPWLLNNLSDRR